MKLDHNLDLIAKRGTEAWKRVKKSRDLNDWWIIADGLQVLQEEAMNEAGIPLGSNHQPTGASYNAAMGQLLDQYKLADIDKGDRSRLLKMRENRADIEKWHRELPLNQRLRLNHPSTVMRHWTKSTVIPKPKGERKPTTLAKTEQALAEALDEIDHLKAHAVELEGARGNPSVQLSFDDLTTAFLSQLQERRKEEKAAIVSQLLLDLNLSLSQVEAEMRKAALKKDLDGLGITEEQAEKVRAAQHSLKKRKRATAQT